jgi:putative transposase
VISPDRRKQAVKQVQQALEVSERRTCRALGQPRNTQRYQKHTADDEVELCERIVSLANRYGRYGYRRITALLQNNGWQVNHKRVEQIWTPNDE